MKKFLILIAFVLLIGCNEVEKESEVKPLQLGMNAIVDQSEADHAKKLVLAMDEVVAVKGVKVNDDFYIAPQVKHFARLKLDKIRKESFNKIKKEYPDANIHVSTDKKIFMELEKIENKLREKKISKENLEKKLKKLEEDMKG